MMTDEAYIAAYRKLIEKYFDGKASMEQHLADVQELKNRYLDARPGAPLPVVP